MNVFDTLKIRGFISQASDEGELSRLLANPGATSYIGFDPSTNSLHLGHFLPIMAMHYLQKAGHRVIFVLGGGTGRLGDPTGKRKMRPLLSIDQIAANERNIQTQVEGMGLLNFHGENAALMVNNDDWLSKFCFLDDFLMNVAKFFSVNEMIKMRTFADRLAKEENLSLMEFCYPVLQAWDYLTLFENYDCRLQMGGQDQWANILQGVNLIQRIHGETVYALTLPLLTTPNGQKMGKTEKGPLWLDPKKTAPFEFYQYLVNIPDENVPQALKLLTFLSLDEIDKTISENPKYAQKRLAYEVTKIVHGEERAKKAQADAERLFGTRMGAPESIPVFHITESLSLNEILTFSGVLPSKSEVERRCVQGGIRINNKKVTDYKSLVKGDCIIRYGKNSFLKIQLKN